MVKITKLGAQDVKIFRKLLITVFKEGFSYYPERAQDYNKKYWNVRRIGKYLVLKNRLLLLCKKDSEPIGFLIGKYYSTGKASILWLGVLKDFRGLGIGRELVTYWEGWAKQKGARTLRASTANFDNEKFYTKLRFKLSHVRERNDWGMEKLVFVKQV
jgi:GNAT superfamily N-acetyltransferase